MNTAVTNPSQESNSTLHLSIEQRAALFDDMVEMVVVLDSTGMLRFANERASSVIGWTVDDAPVSIGRFIHPDDRADMARALERFVEGSTPMRRRRLRVNNGNDPWVWVEILSRNWVGVPGIDGVVVTARDVSDQVAAEQQIIESEHRFRSLITASADAVLMVQPDGTVTYASPKARAILAEVESSTDDLTTAIHPDDLPPAFAAFRAAFAGGVGDHQRVQLRARSTSGSWRWMDASIVNQIGVGGVDALVIYGRDVTAQHEAEEALRSRVDADLLVARIAARFVDVGADEIEQAVIESLAELGAYCEADRAWVFQLHPDGRHIEYTHEWCAPGIPTEIDQLKGFPIQDLPGFAGWIGDPEPLLIRSVASMGPGLARERQMLEAQGIRSLAAQSMFVHEELYGLIGFDAVRNEVTWPDQVVWVLNASANIFGSALRRCEAEVALTLNEARFRAMYEQASDGVRVLDADLRSVYSSPAVSRLTGYGDDELTDPGMRLLLIHPDDRDFVEECRAQIRESPGSTVTGTYRMLRPDGKWVHIEESSTNLLHDPAVMGIVVNMRDVTDRHAHEDELVAQARRDQLTGLPNRLLFEELLDSALARAQLTGSRLAVLALDLDRFRLVNESLGLPTGDLVLDAAARRLRGVLRGGDVVARLSADEFVMLCEPIEDDAEIPVLSDAVLQAFREPFEFDGQAAYTTASLGIAISEAGNPTRSVLMRAADAALHRAKSAGGNRASVFSGDLVDTARDRLELESGLRRALDANEFELHYQPIIELRSGAVIGAEALLRWNHPTRGLLAPTSFLDLTEQTGLIGPVGEWVLAEAAGQLAVWRRAHPVADLSMHVNVSVRQLVDGGVADTIRSVLASTGLDPVHLCIEITESALLAGERPLAELDAVRRCGVLIALDDFGTGHSSLAYLRHLDIDVLKIDRQFVDGLTTGGSDPAIVAAIVSLSDSLGLRTVGEGVETEEQAEALRELGCEHVQGYWFSRPLPADRFEAFLADSGRG